MRIALVSDWCLPRLGGIELQLRDLALQLRRRGHEPEIITPVEGPAQLDGIPVHRLGAPRLPGAGIVFTAAAFRRIRTLLQEGRYDVVHVHFGIIAPAAYGAMWIAQQLGCPAVATFHSVLAHFGVPLRAVRTLLGVEDWRVQWTAVSSVVAEHMRPLVGGAAVTVLPNGIDTAFWSRPGNDRVAGDGIRAVSVMRLHRRKRPRVLLDAARAMGTRGTMEIIGAGPEMRALERAVARKGLGHVVTVAGWKSRDEVRRALHHGDIFVLPSRLEAFGLAALEARAAGLPVIGMAASGVRDFLTHGTDALLAETDEELAGYVGDVASRPELLGRLREGAATPPVGCDWESVVSRIETVYHSAMSTHRHSSPTPRPSR